MNYTMQQMIAFANFCKEYELAPNKLAELISASRSRAKAYVRENQSTETDTDRLSALRRSCANYTERVETLAQALNFTVSWSGLLPVLHRDGHADTLLPC